MTTDDLAQYGRVAPPRDQPLFDGYWAGCAAGELRLPSCSTCGRFHWYPLHRCPHCGSAELGYRPVGSTATLFSWGVIRRALHPAFDARLGQVVALVVPDRAPDVRLVTNLLDADASTLRLGLAVEVEFVSVTTDLILPVHRVVAAESA